MTTQSLIIYALQFAGEDQRLRQQLQEMLELDKHACFCLTEAGGGSDAAGMQTTVFREDGGYQVTFQQYPDSGAVGVADGGEHGKNVFQRGC